MLRLCASAHKPSLLSFSNSSAWVHNVDDFSKPKICFFCHTILIMISKLQKYELTNIVFVSRTQLCMSKEYRAEHWTWKSVFFFCMWLLVWMKTAAVCLRLFLPCVFTQVFVVHARRSRASTTAKWWKKKIQMKFFSHCFWIHPCHFPSESTINGTHTLCWHHRYRFCLWNNA